MNSVFIPQVVYEHGEPWWNDIDRENYWSVHQSSLEILVAKHAVKILHGVNGFTSPPQEGVLWIFIALKNPSPVQWQAH
jgi:hypothetical protein